MTSTTAGFLVSLLIVWTLICLAIFSPYGQILERWRRWRARRRVLNAPPRLLAVMTRSVTWTDLANKREDITFLLLVDGRGRRIWQVHEYGTCATFKWHRKYLGPVLIWQKGGPLPPGAEPIAPLSGRPNLQLVK
jgi:hypothetical protein